ncbi:MAG: IS110 family transposase [Bacteroidales bacterium]|nr:IS110 family transposase [Bacteroidales bacterium]
MKMIYVGIDVAKDKHDCFICNGAGEILTNVFTFENSKSGFEHLLKVINTCTAIDGKKKVGLEAIGHYSYNLIGFLLDNGLPTYVINPLHTNLYRKSLSLRKTKTDKVDARTIASMLMSDVSLKPYNQTLYHNEDLKSLSRYRFDKVKERSKLKTSVSRLINILFPELDKLACSVHMVSIYGLLSEFPSAKDISSSHLTRLTNLLYSVSKGRYNRDTTIMFRDASRDSIGCYMSAKALELKHTINLIRELNTEIKEIDNEIKRIMDKIAFPILSIPGISYSLGAMIISKIGDLSNFSTPDKILAFAGLSPSTYQSGKLDNAYAHMEKRGSKYLRYALPMLLNSLAIGILFLLTILPKSFLKVSITMLFLMLLKKLVRLIFALEKSGQSYISKS